MLGSAGLFAPSAIAAKPRALQAISTQMELVVPVMTLLRLATAVALAALLAVPAAMAEDAPVKHHSLSLIGEPKYPADFKHFDFVNPDAPKGGVVRMAEIGSFDSLNPMLYKGEAAGGLGLVYENSDGRQLGRALDLLRADRRMGVVPGRLFLGHLQAPR